MGAHGEKEPQLRLTPPYPASSFPVLAISVVGILATAILLLSYYVFVIKCCRNCHRSNALSRLARRQGQGHTSDRFTLSPFYLPATVADRGLDESTIQAIPTLRFRRMEQRKSCHDCAVCLSEFQQEEMVRMLPSCLHVFHIDCIDTWLQTHANCPICRKAVTSAVLVPVMQPSVGRGESVAIDVRDDDGDRQAPGVDAGGGNVDRAANSGVGKQRKMHRVPSLGDECIDLRGAGKDEQFAVQTMRRSFSMDSSSDGQLLRAVQEILRQNPHFRDVGNGEGSSAGLGRTRRPFFSFGGHCRELKEFCSSRPK